MPINIFMDFNDIIAASLNLDIDYEKMTSELLAVQDSDKCFPFSYPPNRGDIDKVTAYSLFLRINPTFIDYSYRGAKQANESEWGWDYKLNIPYTRHVIESLPFNILGAIRVVYFPNVPCVEHTDWDDRGDKTHTLGLSLIPSTGNTWCEIWSDELGEYVKVFGNAMLLNDSIKHRVPCSNGTRITMRIFGEIDYHAFDNKIIEVYK